MSAIRILSEYKMSKTNGRVKILEELLGSDIALSERELQTRLKGICDRATIYRTLKALSQKGVIHKIATEGTVAKFVIKKAPDDHIHFKCTDCGKVQCLTGIVPDNVSLPAGYIKKETNFLIIGICDECAKDM
jgi:Fur family ferric uptake transcriptional regulator